LAEGRAAGPVSPDGLIAADGRCIATDGRSTGGGGHSTGSVDTPPEAVEAPPEAVDSPPEPVRGITPGVAAAGAAYELQISRSQLVIRAVDEFVRRYERQALIGAINRAYQDDPPTIEENELLLGIREKQRKLLES